MGKILVVKDADFSNVAIDVVDIPTKPTYTWEQGGWRGYGGGSSGGPTTDINRIRLREESYLVWQNESVHFVSCATGYQIAVFDTSTNVIASDATGFLQNTSFKAKANTRYVVVCRKNDNSNITPQEGEIIKLNIK